MYSTKGLQVEKKLVKIDLTEWVDKVVFENGQIHMYIDEEDWEDVREMFGSAEGRYGYHLSEGVVDE